MNTAEAAGAAGTLDMKYVLTCVLLMALVTYIPRVLPVTIFRKQIRSKFIRSFLDYTPYAVLGALTFSGCIYLHRTSLFVGRRNDRSGDFGI